MDNRYLDNVVKEMRPFLEENGFTAESDFVFKTDSKKVEIEYNDDRQMFLLKVADFSDENGGFGEYREINAWLFDDSQNVKDAESVGIDFAYTLRKELGIKPKRLVTDASAIDLPTATKSDVMNITGFIKKMLDVFPSLKDPYKEHIATYGNFLYIKFFGDYLVDCYKDIFNSNSKKQVKKLYDVLAVAYVKGDKDTVNIIIALLCAAAYKNAEITAEIHTMLAENTHFLQAFNSFMTVFPKNKKLFKALVK